MSSRLTFINGPIQLKVNWLKKLALYSGQTSRFWGTDGMPPHRNGFGVLYHGFRFEGTESLVVVRVKPLASVAWRCVRLSSSLSARCASDSSLRRISSSGSSMGEKGVAGSESAVP